MGFGSHRVQTSPPYIYEEPRPIEGILIESIQNIALLLVSQILAFSNPRLLSSFVSTAFEDVLSGLPTSKQP